MFSSSPSLPSLPHMLASGSRPRTPKSLPNGCGAGMNSSSAHEARCGSTSATSMAASLAPRRLRAVLEPEQRVRCASFDLIVPLHSTPTFFHFHSTFSDFGLMYWFSALSNFNYIFPLYAAPSNSYLEVERRRRRTSDPSSSLRTATEIRRESKYVPRRSKLNPRFTTRS